MFSKTTLALLTTATALLAFSGDLRADEFSIRAHFGKRAVWEIRWKNARESNCLLEGLKGKDGAPKNYVVPQKDCAEARTALNQFVLDLSKKTLRSRDAHLLDEPNYRLEYDHKVIEASMKAPEICKALPSGQLSCRAQEVTSAEALIPIFWEFAYRMGMVSK